MVREGIIVAMCFVAMASPCELLLDTCELRVAHELGRVAAQEAWRIEAKFSRYRPESIVSVINRSQGEAVVVDAETCCAD